MFTNKDQFATAAKASMESQIAVVTDLTNKAMASVAQLVELNINAAKASFEQSSAIAQQMMSAKDPQQLYALATQHSNGTDFMLAYTRNLSSIASAAQVEFTRAAEAQIAETTRKVSALVDEASKCAPAGSENAVAMLKSAMSNANAGYEQLSKSAKQASATLEENMGAATRQFTQAADKASGRSRKQ
ncbi:MAG: TIGR01841 family phasin [Janthinobacterium lividum]